MFKNLLFSTVLSTAFFAASAQDKHSNHEGRSCASPTAEQMIKADPSVAAKIQALEDHTQRFSAQYLSGKGVKQQNAVIIIPVVVHVVYNTAAQNISDAMIQSQIDVLNADFRKLNADRTNTPAAFQGVAADMEIQFQLATKAPGGAATNGIVRKSTTKTYFEYGGADVNGVFVKQASQGGSDAWDPTKYLNMWVCNFGGASSDLLGYATFPTDAGTFKDGVVMGYKFFGVNPSVGGVFGYGRTATHEVGHWVNLRHIWGDANCGNDQVSDTPTQQTSNGGCPTFPKKTCGNTTNGDQFMNYMDYVNDQCMNMFTAGQKARAQALFAAGGARVSLLSSDGLGGGTTTCAAPTGLTSSAITNTSATISWTAVSGSTGYTAQYKASTSSTWLNATVSGTSSGLTGLTAGVTYNFQVQNRCSTTSLSSFTASSFTTSGGTTTPTYCASKGTNVADEWIASVKLARGTTTLFTNTSGKNAGYGNFTATTYNAVRGSAHTITITPAWTATKYNEGYAVWIDYNRDGTFASTELVASNVATQTTPITKTFTIPTTATLGTVRMRVSMKYNAIPTACETFGDGEVEDYTLNITTSAAREIVETSTEQGVASEMNVYPNPASSEATLAYYFATATETATISIYNLQGQEFGKQTLKNVEGNVTYPINVSELKAGMYIVALQYGNTREVKKLVITK